ncbi:hypothetical protein ONZ51_g9408 [Trametes cubensis]|uniref:Uncharacterized protein n=1 Tax=Trametes cubensis TaxID=1111947 RepID=A0AAD7X5N9_9APHY|nr:hypothetical protein ONZ51_g9408 [Trametes cubensis]
MRIRQFKRAQPPQHFQTRHQLTSASNRPIPLSPRSQQSMSHAQTTMTRRASCRLHGAAAVRSDVLDYDKRNKEQVSEQRRSLIGESLLIHVYSVHPVNATTLHAFEPSACALACSTYHYWQSRMLGDAVGVSPGIAPPSTCYNPGRQLPKPLASASMPKRGTDDAWKPSEADDRELRCSARLQQRSKVERSPCSFSSPPSSALSSPSAHSHSQRPRPALSLARSPGGPTSSKRAPRMTLPPAASPSTPSASSPRALHLDPADASYSLPPRRPRKFNPNPNPIDRYGGKPLAARQSSSPCPSPQPKGFIAVLDAEDRPLGFLSRSPNVYGEYRYTEDEKDALRVALGDECAPLTRAPFEIHILNNIGTLDGLPYFGGVVGYYSTDADIIPGSDNYVYVTSTVSVPRGPAQNASNAFTASTGIPSSVQSAIWTLPALPDDPSGVLPGGDPIPLVPGGDPIPLVPHWVNRDGTVDESAQLVYLQDDGGAIVLTGDAEAFGETYGGGARVVKFIFVPDSFVPQVTRTRVSPAITAH